MRKHTKPIDAALIQSGKGRFVSSSDGAAVVIGAQDNPDGDFVPGFRASKWGDVWLSCVAVGVVPEKSKPKTAKDKAGKDCAEHASKRNGKSELHRFRDGSTKWEIEWSKRADIPTDGYVDFLLGFPAGLTFTKQPALTQAEIDDGADRPENVVNSYAVYWQESGRILDANGSEIINRETGKFAHIYRPNLIDADGNATWIDQTLIVDNGTKLRCYLDQMWMQSARYPVVLDPTFGYTSVGGSTQLLNANRVNMLRFPTTAATAGWVANSMSFYCGDTAAAATLGLYSFVVSDTVLICDTAGGSLTTGEWNTQDFDSPATLSAARYRLCIGTSGFTRSHYDSGTESQLYFSWTYSAGNLPTPFGSASTLSSSRTYSIYFTYTEAPSFRPAWIRNRSRIFGGGLT